MNPVENPPKNENGEKLSEAELEKIAQEYVCPVGHENSHSTFRAFGILIKLGKLDEKSVEFLGNKLKERGFCSQDELPPRDGSGTHEQTDTLLGDGPKSIQSTTPHRKNRHRAISYGHEGGSEE